MKPKTVRTMYCVKCDEINKEEKINYCPECGNKMEDVSYVRHKNSAEAAVV